MTSLEGPDLHIRLELEAGERSLFLGVNDQRLHQSNLLTLTADEGMYKLFVASRHSPWSAGALMEVLLKRVLLRGAEPVVSKDLPQQPFNQLALHFVKEEYAIALELANSPQLRHEPRLTGLKALLSCHLSPSTTCESQLSGFLAQTPLEGAMSDSVIRYHLRRNAAMFFPMLLRLRGWDALELMAELWRDSARVHADIQSLQLQLALGLQALDQWTEKPTQLRHCEAYAQLVLMQLRALESFDQSVLAQQLLLGRLQTLQGCLDLPGPDDEKRQLRALLANLEVKLAILYAELGSEDPMLSALEHALRLAPAPEVIAADAAVQPALLRLRSHPKVAALLPHFNYHPPAHQLTYLIP